MSVRSVRSVLCLSAVLTIAACNPPASDAGSRDGTKATTAAVSATTASAMETPATMSATTGGAMSGTAATTGTAGSATMTTPADAKKGNLLGLERPAYDKTNANWKFGVQAPKPAVGNFDPKKDYFATLHTTMGDITVKFYPEVAPKHVTAFINVSEIGYYDDVPFHRIIPGFMAQGGDPAGHGGGGPAYTVPAEFNVRKHVRGTLSAARKGNDINSAGSQFFLMFAPNRGLDGQYTVYGEIVSGLDTLDKLEKIGNPDPRANGKVTQIEKIKSVDVFTKPKA